jgi:hypothetical protein
MGMLGQAALVMWWDIAPGGDADFHEWHAREHFPERLGVPGFLLERRGPRRKANPGVRHSELHSRGPSSAKPHCSHGL